MIRVQAQKVFRLPGERDDLFLALRENHPADKAIAQHVGETQPFPALFNTGWLVHEPEVTTAGRGQDRAKGGRNRQNCGGPEAGTKIVWVALALFVAMPTLLQKRRVS